MINQKLLLSLVMFFLVAVAAKCADDSALSTLLVGRWQTVGNDRPYVIAYRADHTFEYEYTKQDEEENQPHMFGTWGISEGYIRAMFAGEGNGMVDARKIVSLTKDRLIYTSEGEKWEMKRLGPPSAKPAQSPAPVRPPQPTAPPVESTSQTEEKARTELANALAAEENRENSQRKQEESEQQAAQKQLQDYFDRRLSEVPTRPEVQVSAQLRARNFSTEIIGAHLKEFRELVRNHDGRGVIALLYESRTLESKEEANSLVERMGLNCFVRVRPVTFTRSAPDGEGDVFVVNVKRVIAGQFVNGLLSEDVAAGWRLNNNPVITHGTQPDPDGNGMLMPCSTADGTFLFFKRPGVPPNNPTPTIDVAYQRLQQDYSKRINYLNARLEIGELTKAQAASQTLQIQDEMRKTIFSWLARY